MSYDLYIGWPPCAACGREEFTRAGDGLWWNYTSNVAPMWCHAGADLSEFDGKRCSDCAPILSAAIGRMEADPATYRVMDSPNGWGTYDRLLPALHRLLVMLEEHPKAFVRVLR